MTTKPGTEARHHWPVFGHDWAVTFLQKSLLNRRVRHAYLLSGTANIGKNQLAHAFAMALNCEQDDETLRPCGQCRSCRLIYSGNHPDMLYAQLDEKTGALRIDSIREVMRLIALKPFDSRYRVAIFQHFDAAQPRAQDALLKTLEEPPPHAIILLLAQDNEHIMPTITSRCQLLPLRPAPQQLVRDFLMLHGAEEERATLIARLSGGRIGWSLSALQDETILAQRDEVLQLLSKALKGNRAQRFDVAEELGKVGSSDKASLRYVLEMWQTYWRDVLLLAQGSPVKPCNSDRRIEMEQLVQRIDADEALQALHATRRLLYEVLSTNANLRMALEVMFLDYPGLARG